MSDDYRMRKESYVYTLLKPDGTVFYVGQGMGNRILFHEREARNGVQSRKCDVIRQIWPDGGEIIRMKVQENITYYEAVSLEDKLIAEYKPLGNLTNIGQKVTHNRSRISIPIPSVRGDLAKRFRRLASTKAGRKLSDAELLDFAKELAYRAIDAYCEGIE